MVDSAPAPNHHGSHGSSGAHPHTGFRSTLRGRIYTALFFVCLLLALEPYLVRFTELQAGLLAAIAAPSRSPFDNPVATVLISEDEYAAKDVFAGKSPLNPVRLATFFRRLHDKYKVVTPLKRPIVIGIDLDLWPATPLDVQNRDRKKMFDELRQLSRLVPIILVEPEMQHRCRDGLEDCAQCNFVRTVVANSDIVVASASIGEAADTFSPASPTLGVVMWQRGMRLLPEMAPADTEPYKTIKQWLFKKGDIGSKNSTYPAAGICAATTPSEAKAKYQKEILRRTQSAHSYSMLEFERNPLGLPGLYVLIGGDYDVRDTVQPLGLSKRIPSAIVHAWTLNSMSRVHPQLSKAAIIALEVAVGCLIGWVFGSVWAKIAGSGGRFASLAGWYVLFWALLLGLILFTLLYAPEIRQSGIDVSSLALLTLGMLLDGMISAHENLIHQAQHSSGGNSPPRPSLADHLVAIVWLLVQWGIIGGVVISKVPKDLSLPAATAILTIAGVCYFYRGGPLLELYSGSHTANSPVRRA